MKKIKLKRLILAIIFGSLWWGIMIVAFKILDHFISSKIVVVIIWFLIYIFGGYKLLVLMIKLMDRLKIRIP